MLFASWPYGFGKPPYSWIPLSVACEMCRCGQPNDESQHHYTFGRKKDKFYVEKNKASVIRRPHLLPAGYASKCEPQTEAQQGPEETSGFAKVRQERTAECGSWYFYHCEIRQTTKIAQWVTPPGSIILLRGARKYNMSDELWRCLKPNVSKKATHSTILEHRHWRGRCNTGSASQPSLL